MSVCQKKWSKSPWIVQYVNFHALTVFLYAYSRFVQVLKSTVWLFISIIRESFIDICNPQCATPTCSSTRNAPSALLQHSKTNGHYFLSDLFWALTEFYHTQRARIVDFLIVSYIFLCECGARWSVKPRLWLAAKCVTRASQVNNDERLKFWAGLRGWLRVRKRRGCHCRHQGALSKTGLHFTSEVQAAAANSFAKL